MWTIQATSQNLDHHFIRTYWFHANKKIFFRTFHLLSTQRKCKLCFARSCCCFSVTTHFYLISWKKKKRLIPTNLQTVKAWQMCLCFFVKKWTLWDVIANVNARDLAAVQKQQASNQLIRPIYRFLNSHPRVPYNTNQANIIVLAMKTIPNRFD